MRVEERSTVLGSRKAALGAAGSVWQGKTIQEPRARKRSQEAKSQERSQETAVRRRRAASEPGHSGFEDQRAGFEPPACAQAAARMPCKPMSHNIKRNTVARASRSKPADSAHGSLGRQGARRVWARAQRGCRNRHAARANRACPRHLSRQASRPEPGGAPDCGGTEAAKLRRAVWANHLSSTSLFTPLRTLRLGSRACEHTNVRACTVAAWCTRRTGKNAGRACWRPPRA